MVGWHHWLDGHEFEQVLGIGNCQGSLVCCSTWGGKESDTWATELNWRYICSCLLSPFRIVHSCLTMPSCPWLVDLTFQVHMQYCSLASDIIFINRHIYNWAWFPSWFSSFITHCSSPIVFQPGGLFSVSYGFAFLNGSCGSQQEHWSASSFPPPMDHILLGLSIMTHPSWVALHGMAHSFIELY